MPSTLIESFELLIEAEQLAPRLEAAATALGQLPELAAEQGWLAAARDRLATTSVTSYGDLLVRALRLPELESLKGERGKLLQGAIADEFDRLQAAITLAGGPRSPLLEMLLQSFKVPPLRTCKQPDIERFCAELERRLSSTYAKRVLGTERYLPVRDNVRALAAAIATWRGVFIDPPLGEDAAVPVREELAAAGRAVEQSLRQARLLAQAALLPAAELLDAAGVLTATAKRRGKNADSHPLLEQDPPDPLLPTPEERAELATPRAVS